MSTFRRDKLKRLIEAGKVELVGAYSFDDMHGASRTTESMPVAIGPGDWKLRKEGTCYLRGDLFEGYGRAYEKDGGLVTLYVHSNLNYTFRILR